MPRRTLLSVALVAVLATSCSSGEVELQTPEPHGAVETVCRLLLEDAPATVAGQSARPVDPTGAGKAWGDPAITLQCGVSKPAGLQPTSRCAEIDGVGWFADKQEDGYVFTTIGRKAYVQVTVPSEYDPEADALVDLANAVKDHDPVVRECA